MAIDKIFDGAVDGIADNLFNSVSNSVSEIKAMQQRKAAENVQLVVQALKKIDVDIREKYDGVTATIEKRVANIKDGRDGIDGKNGLNGVNGKDGRDGKDGRNGRDGLTGPRGFDGPKGMDGKDGQNGEDGVSVTDAHIDFDGSLIISLSSGRVINVGEVVAADIAEKIKVITNGGGTSQPVLDQLASLQAQIDLISSALVYKGTWDASTNTPTLTSSAGTANTFYIVSVAGTTTLNGTSNWGVGDWAVFNGSVWQRIEGGAVGNFTDLSVSGTTTLSGLTASTALALNASKQVVSVTNTGSGNNVLATSPTLVTPVLGTPSSVTLTNATGLPLSTGVTGTLPIANGGTGATTANTAFNALAPSQASNSGKYLTTNGSTTSWATVTSGTVTSVSGTGTVNGLTLTGTVTSSGSLTLGGTLSGISNAALTNSSITINGTATSLGGSINVGTVTSVAATVPSFLSITGSPITSSGTLAISLSGTALPTTSGGTGLTSFTANGVVYASSSSALTTGSALTFDGSKLVNTGYNKSTYQVSTNNVGTFESVGAAYLAYDSISGANIYARSGASTESTLNFRASTFSFKIGGTQVSSLDSSSFSLYNTPFLLSGSTSGYTGFAAPATSNFTIYTLPSADGTSGQSLTTNGSGTLSWASGTGGTVTSVAASVPTFLSISGSPITSSGTLAITLSGTALPTTSGGTGLTSFTANGVVYASSTSALTTGSALTFDGTNFATTGKINVGSPSSTLSRLNVKSADAYLADFVGSDGTLGLFLFNDSSIPSIGTRGGDQGLNINAAGSTSAARIAFTAGASEGMRLTSTGLGIGTSSPSFRLDVQAPTGVIKLTATTGTNASYFRADNTGGILYFGLDDSVASTFGTAGAYGTVIQRPASTAFNINRAGTVDMYINTTGNVGIGTSSPTQKLTVSVGDTAQAVQFRATTGLVRLRPYVDSTYGAIFESTNSAESAYLPLTLTGSNVFTNPDTAAIWRVANTEQMRLTSTGLGIGTSSPVSKLQVVDGDITVTTSGSFSGFNSTRATIPSSVGIQLGKLNFSAYSTGTTYVQGASIQSFSSAAWSSTSAPSYLSFQTTASGSTSLTERMIIDSSGNLGLGVTPSGWSLSGLAAMQVKNGGLYGYDLTEVGVTSNAYYGSSAWRYISSAQASRFVQVSGQHQWYTAPSGTAGNAITFTQAMTLTAGSTLLIDTTSDNGATGFAFIGSGTSSVQRLIIGHPSGNGSGSQYHQFYYNGSEIGSISQSGTTAVLYNTTSDQRLKENITDADSASALIDSLQVRKFDWKADGSHQRYGFVAQELATVYPEAVHQPEDTEQMMAVDYSKLVPLLVKEIQSLKARLDAANL